MSVPCSHADVRGSGTGARRRGCGVACAFSAPRDSQPGPGAGGGPDGAVQARVLGRLGPRTGSEQAWDGQGRGRARGPMKTLGQGGGPWGTGRRSGSPSCISCRVGESGVRMKGAAPAKVGSHGSGSGVSVFGGPVARTEGASGVVRPSDGPLPGGGPGAGKRRRSLTCPGGGPSWHCAGAGGFCLPAGSKASEVQPPGGAGLLLGCGNGSSASSAGEGISPHIVIQDPKGNKDSRPRLPRERSGEHPGVLGRRQTL